MANRPYVVALCGTPGTGKSTLLKRLVKKMGSDRVDTESMSELVRSKKLYDEYDVELDAAVMDTSAVKKALVRVIRGSSKPVLLIETHTPSALPAKHVDLIVVLRTDTAPLYDRLASRGYSQRKIDENVDCEIMQIVYEEASRAKERNARSAVLCLDSNTKSDLKASVRCITERLKLNKPKAT